jgi:secondary thiamine-phosphate synthase enzyme
MILTILITMTSHSEILLETEKKIQFINITREIEEKLGPTAKACLAFVPHATAGLIMNEDEPGLLDDYKKLVKRLTGAGPFEHDRIDDNAQAHLAASILKPSLLIPVKEGRLLRGTWQEVFFVELDGPRARRRVVLQMI